MQFSIIQIDLGKSHLTHDKIGLPENGAWSGPGAKFLNSRISCIYTVSQKTCHLFRSTPNSRPNNMGQMYVRGPSVRSSSKSFSDSDEIWYADRGR